LTVTSSALCQGDSTGSVTIKFQNAASTSCAIGADCTSFIDNVSITGIVCADGYELTSGTDFNMVCSTCPAGYYCTGGVKTAGSAPQPTPRPTPQPTPRPSATPTITSGDHIAFTITITTTIIIIIIPSLLLISSSLLLPLLSTSSSLLLSIFSLF